MSPQMRRGPRKARAGSKTISLSKLSTPSTAIPRIRKGKSKSHTSGYRTKAKRASGQQKTSRMHHNRKVSMVLYTSRNVSKFQACKHSAFSSQHSARIQLGLKRNGSLGMEQLPVLWTARERSQVLIADCLSKWAETSTNSIPAIQRKQPSRGRTFS